MTILGMLLPMELALPHWHMTLVCCCFRVVELENDALRAEPRL